MEHTVGHVAHEGHAVFSESVKPLLVASYVFDPTVTFALDNVSFKVAIVAAVTLLVWLIVTVATIEPGVSETANTSAGCRCAWLATTFAANSFLKVSWSAALSVSRSPGNVSVRRNRAVALAVVLVPRYSRNSRL